MSSCCSSDVAYRPQRPQGLLGTGAQLESHATAFLCFSVQVRSLIKSAQITCSKDGKATSKKGDDAVYGQHVEVRRLGFPGITFAE